MNSAAGVGVNGRGKEDCCEDEDSNIRTLPDMGSQNILQSVGSDSKERITELTYQLKDKLSVTDGHRPMLNGYVVEAENELTNHHDVVVGTPKFYLYDSIKSKDVQNHNSSHETHVTAPNNCKEGGIVNIAERIAQIDPKKSVANMNNDLIGLSLMPLDYLNSASLPTVGDIVYVGYKSELQMPDIMRLIQKDLSEPYSVYTYRYFIHNWPKLCFLAMQGENCVGAVVCKLDLHKKIVRRGYIAMLAVDKDCRKRKIGTNLVLKAIQAMIMDDADEIVLETEITNRPALQLYENLGFVRDKRLFRYYLNGVDALRLKLWLR